MTTDVQKHGLLKPKIKQFLRVPPSRYEAMQACLLREVWTASGNEPLLPPSPYTELGSVAHQILEAAGRGELKSDINDKIEAVWDALVAEAEARMILSPLRQHQVPLSQSVPDFQVRKLRTCRRAAEIAYEVGQSSIGRSEQFHRSIGFELWVESDDAQVGGFIDRVSVTTKGVILSDYKSGAVLDSEHEDRLGELKYAYKIQMELYAALYWQKERSWPISLKIIPLQGKPLEVHLDPAHAQLLLDEAKAFLQSANARIAAVETGAADATVLATPQPKNCRWCLFRPACEVYWIACRSDAAGKWPIDVRGIVEQSMCLRNGRVCLRICGADSTMSSHITVRNITNSIYRHPLLDSISTGNRVAVYGLRRDNRCYDYSETQNTVIYMTD